MKRARLSYHCVFPWTPVSGWAGGRRVAWQPRNTASGQPMKPVCVDHPFSQSLKHWCLLEVEFSGVELQFATVAEPDHVMAVLGQNPMPSGGSLLCGQRLGRPNRHWLSRLPAKAKPKKFRTALIQFLHKNREVAKFREFYRRTPPVYLVPGLFDSFDEAKREAPTA